MHEEITQGCVPNKRDVAVNQPPAAATGSLRTSTGAASEISSLTAAGAKPLRTSTRVEPEGQFQMRLMSCHSAFRSEYQGVADRIEVSV